MIRLGAPRRHLRALQCYRVPRLRARAVPERRGGPERWQMLQLQLLLLRLLLLRMLRLLL